MSNKTNEINLTVRYNNYVPAKFPAISKPKIIGFFSVDGERNYNPTCDKLKYLKLPGNKKINFDLNLGYEKVIRKAESHKNEKIDHLLRFIVDHKDHLARRTTEDPRALGFDFVCFRGLLRQIMCSPYEYKDDWCILATKYEGNIYLCAKETDQRRHEKLTETELQKKFCSYGFKFEQYVLSEEPNKEPDPSVPVNENEEFACVFSSSLEDHQLLYGAEMDGILSSSIYDMENTDINKMEFIEVKVKRRESNSNQRRNFLKFKLRDWWCQSFLVGIEKIYIGTRNDYGIVEEISMMQMKNIPKMSSEYWSASVCVDFLSQFLRTIRKVLSKVNSATTVYEFYWNPRPGNIINYKIHYDKNEYSFLPEWYLQEIRPIIISNDEVN